MRESFSKTKLGAILLVVLALVGACKTDPDSILGHGMHDENELVAKYDTAFTIEAFSVSDDSLILQNGSDVLIGASYSPVWGGATYNLVVQLLSLRTTDTAYHSGFLTSNFRVDSVVLKLPYSTFYPQHQRMDGRALTFSLYEVTEDLVDGTGYDSAYSSNYQVDYNPVPLIGPITVYPRPYDTLTDTVDGVATTTVPPLHVKLDNRFGTQLLNYVLAMSSSEQEDISALPNYFKGLYLKVDPCNSEGESIVFSVSNLYAEGACITVYFDGNGTSTSYQNFILGPLRFTQVIRDRERSVDQLYKNQMDNQMDTASGNQRLYIEGSGGSRVRFRIPKFPSEINGDKIVINQAVIVLKNVDEGKESDIGYPEQLQCFIYHNRGTESDLPDASDPGGLYDEGRGEYRLNVTRYFQRLAYLNTVDTANGKYYQDYVDISPISDDRYEKPTRVVLYGPRAAKDPMQMEIIYTIVNDTLNR